MSTKRGFPQQKTLPRHFAREKHCRSVLYSGWCCTVNICGCLSALLHQCSSGHHHFVVSMLLDNASCTHAQHLKPHHCLADHRLSSLVDCISANISRIAHTACSAILGPALCCDCAERLQLCAYPEGTHAEEAM